MKEEELAEEVVAERTEMRPTGVGTVAWALLGLKDVYQGTDSSTTVLFRPTLVAYRAPVLSGLLLLLALAAWAVFESYGLRQSYRDRVKLEAGYLAMVTEQAILGFGRARSLPLESAQPFLAALIERTPNFHSAALVEDGVRRVVVGPSLPEFELDHRVTQYETDESLCFGIAFQEDEARAGEVMKSEETPEILERLRSNANVPLAAGTPALVVAAPLRSKAFFKDPEFGKILQTVGIGTLGILALVLAWIQSNLQRSLADRLRNERAARTRWQELSLAASGLAHETKNPLGIIRGLAQRIVDTADGSQEDRDRASKIVEQADRAAARLGDFLSYARMREPEPVVIDLGPLLERAVGVLQPDFEAAGVPIQLDIEDARIRADREMLMQIFLNLVLNALEASEPGQALLVSFRVNEGRGCLSVQDQGCGIEPAFLPRVFKPYVSGRPEGHGLGLAIVQRFVEQQGWTISVHSELGKGTRFDIDGMQVVITEVGRASWHGF